MSLAPEMVLDLRNDAVCSVTLLSFYYGYFNTYAFISLVALELERGYGRAGGACKGPGQRP